MLHIVIPILLILVGLALVFLKSGKKPTPSTASTATESPGKPEENTKTTKSRSVPLEDLVVPGNFPKELVFYFGSQTGTAEKFCGYL